MKQERSGYITGNETEDSLDFCFVLEDNHTDINKSKDNHQRKEQSGRSEFTAQVAEKEFDEKEDGKSDKNRNENEDGNEDFDLNVLRYKSLCRLNNNLQEIYVKFDRDFTDDEEIDLGDLSDEEKNNNQITGVQVDKTISDDVTDELDISNRVEAENTVAGIQQNYQEEDQNENNDQLKNKDKKYIILTDSDTPSGSLDQHKVNKDMSRENMFRNSKGGDTVTKEDLYFILSQVKNYFVNNHKNYLQLSNVIHSNFGNNPLAKTNGKGSREDFERHLEYSGNTTLKPLNSVQGLNDHKYNEDQYDCGFGSGSGSGINLLSKTESMPVRGRLLEFPSSKPADKSYEKRRKSTTSYPLKASDRYRQVGESTHSVDRLDYLPSKCHANELEIVRGLTPYTPQENNNVDVSVLKTDFKRGLPYVMNKNSIPSSSSNRFFDIDNGMAKYRHSLPLTKVKDRSEVYHRRGIKRKDEQLLLHDENSKKKQTLEFCAKTAKNSGQSYRSLSHGKNTNEETYLAYKKRKLRETDHKKEQRELRFSPPHNNEPRLLLADVPAAHYRYSKNSNSGSMFHSHTHTHDERYATPRVTRVGSLGSNSAFVDRTSDPTLNFYKHILAQSAYKPRERNYRSQMVDMAPRYSTGMYDMESYPEQSIIFAPQDLRSTNRDNHMEYNGVGGGTGWYVYPKEYSLPDTPTRTSRVGIQQHRSSENTNRLINDHKGWMGKASKRYISRLPFE